MLRHKLIFLCLLFPITALLSACASKPVVYSDFDPRHDFSENQTFTWVHEPPMLQAGDHPVSALAETRMTAAIKGTLINKGYVFVHDKTEADLSVVYTMGARDKIEVVKHPSGYYRHRRDWGWGAYYFPYFVHFPFSHERPNEEGFHRYTDGTIALDIFDTRSQQPIWHTKASKRLSRKDLDSDAKNAEEIAERMLRDFPMQGCDVQITDECRPFKMLDAEDIEDFKTD